MNVIIDIFDFLWGYPLIIFIILSGLYFSFRIRFIQITGIK